MQKTLSAVGLVLTGMLLTQLNASAQVASTTYGGHTYDLWAGNLSWSAAEAAAVADGGYLAVLTDAAETTAVYDSLIVPTYFAPGGEGLQAWLGGFTADLSGSTQNPSNWAWVTSESWTAFDAGNFAGGEPNGDSEGLAINRFGTPQWNDEGGFVGGYIVEKNGVPDGGLTSILLGTSLLGLAFLRRKF